MIRGQPVLTWYGRIYFVLPQLVAAGVVHGNGLSWWWLGLSAPLIAMVCAVSLRWAASRDHVWLRW